MPNGGVLPSCFTCTWSEENEPESFNLVHCKQHDFFVWSPMFHVCNKLRFSWDEHSTPTFVQEVDLENDRIYAWLQFAYSTPEAPTIPQYHHELIKLASLQEHQKWSIQEKEEAYQQARAKKEQELLNSSNEKE